MAGKATKKESTEIVVAKPIFDVETVKFDYTEATIKELVKQANKVDLSDLEAVREAHKVMVKIRTTLTEQGLEFRRQINEIPKAIKAKEDGYLALSMDTEIKLKQVLDDDKQAKIMEARQQLLPMKRDQLALLVHIREVTDEEVLAMDDKQWVAFYQDMMNVNATEIQRLKDKEEAEAKAEEERLAAIEEGKKQGAKEAEEKAEREKQEAKEKEEREAKEAEEAQAKKEEEEAQAKAELEESEKYKDFLKKNKFNPKTDKLFNVDGELSIYRFVAKAKIKIKK